MRKISKKLISSVILSLMKMALFLVKMIIILRTERKIAILLFMILKKIHL